jgi:hypothetical protein
MILAEGKANGEVYKREEAEMSLKWLKQREVWESKNESGDVSKG